MKYRAVIFDMDGTLVDNMRYHASAWLEFGRRRGLTVTRERFEHLKGELAERKNSEILPLLLGPGLNPDELRALADEKESIYRELYRPQMALVRGARELLGRLAERGIRRAVASAAPQANRELVLDVLEVADAFEAVVGDEHVTRGKPAPDLFLAAARDLDVEPAACLVFEDAVNGVLSARAAGMDAVGLTTGTPAAELLEAGARWAAPDFTMLPAEICMG